MQGLREPHGNATRRQHCVNVRRVVLYTNVRVGADEPKKIATVMVRMAPDQHAELREEAAAGVHQSTIIREGIDLALKKRKRERDGVP